MGIFGSIKKGLDVLKGAFMVLAIVFAYNLVTGASIIGIIGLNPTPEKITEISGMLFGVFALMLFLWIVLTGGVFKTIESLFKNGSMDMGEFFGNCFKFFPRLLGVNILSGLISVAIWFLGAFLAGLFIAMGGGDNPFLNVVGGILMFATVILSFVVAIPLLVAQYLVVLEDGPVIASIKRAVTVVLQGIWKFIGLFVSIGCLIFVVALIVNVVANLIGSGIGGIGAAVINTIVSACTNTFVGVFASASIIAYILDVLPPASEEEEEETAAV